jgi:polyhydroxybutyrate depolymerase
MTDFDPEAPPEPHDGAVLDWLPTRRRPALRRWWAAALVLAAAAVVVPAALLATAEPQSVRVVAAPQAHGAGRGTAAGKLQGSAQAQGQDQIVTMQVDGVDRSYRLFVPTTLPPTRHHLLVALHWFGGSAARLEAMSGLDRMAAANNTVIAYPDGLGHSWDAGTCCGYATHQNLDDVAFVLKVVADVEHRVTVDPHYIAATGFSNGALMSYRLVCERPDVFRVAIAVAGGAVGARCEPQSPVTLLHVHGARDRVIPIAGERSSKIDASGFPPAATSVQRIADADRCTDASTSSDDKTITWTAKGCAGGAVVRFVTVRMLGHHYPTGASAQASYGVDMSTLTWTFLLTAWPS